MAPSIESLFPTPLYWNKINDQRAVLKEFEGLLPSLNFDYLEKWGKTHKLNDNAFSTNLPTTQLNCFEDFLLEGN